jgi:hypothetical protein
LYVVNPAFSALLNPPTQAELDFVRIVQVEALPENLDELEKAMGSLEDQLMCDKAQRKLFQEANDRHSEATDPPRIPPGKYPAEIKNRMTVELLNGDIACELVFKITSGEFAGRHVWHRIRADEAGQFPEEFFKSVGVVRIEQIDVPIDGRLLCEIELDVHVNANDMEWNRVIDFKLIKAELPDVFSTSTPSSAWAESNRE